MAEEKYPSKKKLTDERLKGNLLKAPQLVKFSELCIFGMLIFLLPVKTFIAEFLKLSSSLFLLKFSAVIKQLLIVAFACTICLPLAVLSVKILSQIMVTHYLNQGFILFKLSSTGKFNVYENISKIASRLAEYKKFLLNSIFALSLVIVTVVLIAVFQGNKYLDLMENLDLINKGIVSRLNGLVTPVVMAVLLTGLYSLIEMVINRFNYINSLKMSKEEVRKEHQEQEGNSEIRQYQRSLADELLSASLEERVKRSKVILVG